MNLLSENAKLPISYLSQALDFSRASFYRFHQPPPPKTGIPNPSNPPLALAPFEESEALSVLHSEEFADSSPANIYHTLLEQGKYLCSIRTFYRILEKNREVRERRNQLRHPRHKKPELVATAPNQVWTWDITKLKGPVKWTYYYLYVLLDIYSRYVVGWLVADRESSTFAKQLIGESFHRHNPDPATLFIHSDRGSPMKSKTTLQFLSDLGISYSFSRPRVSNDNPYSESQFKTLKYSPVFPDRFGSIQDSTQFTKNFIHWYNYLHKHSGIAYLSPADVHFGRTEAILATRQLALDEAFTRNPTRFKGKLPRVQNLPDSVWINPPISKNSEEVILA